MASGQAEIPSVWLDPEMAQIYVRRRCKGCSEQSQLQKEYFKVHWSIRERFFNDEQRANQVTK